MFLEMGTEETEYFLVDRLLEVDYLQKAEENVIDDLLRDKKMSMVRRSAHKLDHLVRRHPRPLLKLGFLSSISQKIDFIFFPSELKEKPAFFELRHQMNRSTTLEKNKNRKFTQRSSKILG